MKIRPLEAGLCRALVPLVHDWETFYRGRKESTSEEVRSYLERILDEPSGGAVIVACEGEQILAFATYAILYPAPCRSGQLYMKELFVSPGARGRGVGKKMMKYLARLACSRGCSRFDWTAERTNPGAGAFYRELGARTVSEKEYYRLDGADLERFAGIPLTVPPKSGSAPDPLITD
ncbi:acetyltransferase [Alkalispirochaeta sphaeroplastigenens]|uniref:Acetyltransferase n=1 Tax=Alkalispirochaeta sphaeroplastigenens TaxID=1187066 RepID=A0A2S4JG13_9SPIO|nr:GNAT family N-acetyltransferase [Alkalispirochaeta sphaeroplastigenens]POQ98456.1 acetyltransferase [Alkalispirochaeta sphaeroplastigenens]